jgi:hypothetical protein
MNRHGIPERQPTPLSLKSAANKDPGLFGRMFPGLPALKASDDALLALAKAMKDSGPADNPKVPAGITYLGQFIDHDISLDLTSLAEKINDPDAKENFRSPAVDLDSVYGLGPDGSPHLFERDPVTLKTGAKLLLGTAAKSPKLTGPGDIPDMPDHDLPRNPRTGTAIIPDARNDENLLVAQTHVAIMRFHNKVVDKLKADGVPPGDLFAQARNLVVWHYQWIVLHEFLEALTGEPGIADRILHQGRKFYRFKKWPFIPVEFSVAAYRLGHSMVREVYSHNFIFRPGHPPNTIPPATLKLLFDFTAKSGQIVGSLLPAGVPLPQPVLPSNWVIDWRRFFDFGTPPAPGFQFNFAQPLDPFITAALHTLPGETSNSPGAILPFRNLRRGVMMGLPSGQAIAKAMGLKPLTQAEIGSGPDGAAAVANKLHKATPLWYYILKEAEQRGNREHLGPVGKTIVAEVFVGLVQGSRNSYLSAAQAFKPSLGPVPGTFTMVDLLTFADTVNPIGNG